MKVVNSKKFGEKKKRKEMNYRFENSEQSKIVTEGF